MQTRYTQVEATLPLLVHRMSRREWLAPSPVAELRDCYWAHCVFTPTLGDDADSIAWSIASLQQQGF